MALKKGNTIAMRRQVELVKVDEMGLRRSSLDRRQGE